MVEYNNLVFILDGKEISVEEINSSSIEINKKFHELIRNYYIRIRHLTCDTKCGAPRDYNTVLNKINKVLISSIIPELTNNHIDFILKEIKIINPTLK